MNVAELLLRITSRELTEWIAFEQLTGTLGPGRHDMGFGTVAATVANAFRRRGAASFKPQEFMPFKRAEDHQVAETAAAKRRSIRALFEGLVAKTKGLARGEGLKSR